MSEQPAPAPPSAWAPLRQRVFLAFWLANLASLVGTWVHQVGAAWLMTSLSPSPLWVALVQAATSLPVFVLALPGGALADIVDRRRLLLTAQLWMLIAAVALGLATLSGGLGPLGLLGLTALLGVGAAINAPVWQAVLPELVPDDELPAAVALGSVGFNIARAVGPALGGLLVAAAGPGVAFLVNAGSFLGVLLVVFGWRRRVPPPTLPPESVIGAVIAGLRFVRHQPPLRAVLVRAGAFMLCGSALWALLPIVAKQELGADATEYGLLLGSLGAGAVTGAFLLGKVRSQISMDALVAAAAVLLAAVVAVVAQVRVFGALLAALALGGVAWLALLSSFNTAVQLLVPAWVRGRAVAVYLLVFSGASTAGSALWGGVAAQTSTELALLVSAGGLLAGLVLIPRFPLPRARPTGLGPWPHWPAPITADAPAHDAGPVFVQVHYQVDPTQTPAFLQALTPLRAARHRTGAYAWYLLHDAAAPGRYVEQFQVASWLDHLRQHERVSEADQALQDAVNAYHQGPDTPRVEHLIAAPSRAA